jgi:hypothetical protein
MSRQKRNFFKRGELGWNQAPDITNSLSNIFAAPEYGGTSFKHWIDENSRSNGYDTGDLIENPAYVIESILRDVLNIPTDQIDYTSFDTAGNTTNGTLKDWKFAGGIYEIQKSKEVLNSLCAQCKSRLYRNPSGKFSLLVYNSSDPVNYSDYSFDTTNNIKLTDIYQTSYDDIANNVYINYWLDRGSEKFAKNTYIKCNKVFSETYLNEAVDNSEYEIDVIDGTKFTANDIIMIDREINKVLSISTNTLTLYHSAGLRTAFYDSQLATHLNNSAIYKISKGSDDGDGSTADVSREDLAIQSLCKYGSKNKIEIDADFIRDKTTAVNLRNYYFDFYCKPHWILEFDTILKASDLKIGDIIDFDHTIMDSDILLGGESWENKKFRVDAITKTGSMSYHIQIMSLDIEETLLTFGEGEYEDDIDEIGPEPS